MISFWEHNSFTQYDIIIVGAGITGLSTACSVKEKQPDKNILVLERGIFPTGASTKNAGFACFAKACEMLSDMKLTDAETVAQLALQRKKGLEKLRHRLGDHKIGYLHNGGYELIFNDDETFDPSQIEQLNQQLLPHFGTQVFYLKDEQIGSFGFANTRHLIYTPLEGQIDTGMMMDSLARYATQLGVKIIYGAEVIEFDETEQGGVSVFVHHHQLNENIEFTCNKMALCTNALMGEFLPQLGIKPGRGQVLVTSPIDNLKFTGTFHFDEGYFYFRNYNNRVLFGGGRNIDFKHEETFVFDQNPIILNRLKQLLKEVILPNTEFEIEQNWQGIMGFSPNKQPIVQPITDTIMVGFGCNGMGVALGSHTGEQLATMLIGG